jgi:hypothetical protein
LIKQVQGEEKIPTDWRTGLILPTHKKLSKDKCKNYRGITLLPQLYKILSSFLYNRVVRYAGMTIGDYKKIFRSGCETNNNIFILRQITDKAYEYNIKYACAICRLQASIWLHKKDTDI